MIKEDEKKGFSKEELTVLRSKLPDDWNAILAGQFNISIRSVENILRGWSKNESVVLAAVELAEKHQLKIKQAKEAIQTL